MSEYTKFAPLAVNAYTACSALGRGVSVMHDAIRAHTGGLQKLADIHSPELQHIQLDTYVGVVAGLDQPLPLSLQNWDCRNSRLAWAALQSDNFIDHVQRAIQRYGASRIALIIGTSTSSIGATEQAYAARLVNGDFPSHLSNDRLHNIHSQTALIQRILRLQGPCLTISTACSSSAKVFGAAERLIRLQLVDAVVVGGVDSLCGSVLYGFHSLDLVSAQMCQPFDQARCGINLGEAAGFALLERPQSGSNAPLLIGCGESSDAHHMSAPDPGSAGAQAAFERALECAHKQAHEIDYFHLHGTATILNDELEAQWFNRIAAPHAYASSTKSMTGHTLGAAGILGAIFCLLALEHGELPGTLNTRTLSPLCGPQFLLSPIRQTIHLAASNSFAFGGSNCILLWAKP